MPDVKNNILFFVQTNMDKTAVMLKDTFANSPSTPSVDYMYPIEYMADLLLYKIKKTLSSLPIICIKTINNGLIITEHSSYES